MCQCGQGVPERTKGYFTSHVNAVSKVLHGYHVQITARSDADIQPETIVQKVADASGSKYSGGAAMSSTPAPGPPPVASKPVFQPTRVGGAAGGFNPLGSRVKLPQAQDQNVDADGWGADAPPVSRSQIEKVPSAYQPTKVNIADLTSQQQDPVRLHGMGAGNPPPSNGNPDVVRGGYQPIGKVDIAEIRRQAQASGSARDDRPTTVKGAYEPVGKVDIAEIRRRAQGPGGADEPKPAPIAADEPQERPQSLADRSAAFQQSERLTTLPKPKVANRFGGQSSFQGTKAPTVSEYGAKPLAPSAPVGTASKTFADEGGKTPAQIWAEKKARQGGGAPSSYTGQPPSQPIAAQTSGGGGWKSGYTGKSWATVQTTKTGQSAASNASREEEEPQEPASAGGVGSIRDRFAGAAPIVPAASRPVPQPTDAPEPPPMDMSSKPNAGGAVPGLPTRPRDVPEEQHVNVPPPPAMVPRPAEDDEEEEEIRPSSPIRIAQPVARSAVPDIEPANEPEHAVPAQSLAQAASSARDMTPEPHVQEDDPARGASQAAAVSTFGAGAAAADHGAEGGPRAVVEFDYEKAEENEIELREGAFVTDVDQVDPDWWMGTNE
ncbi:MAG: hypothetical protein INR71_08695, partial [Terriglobus roseus]|nr:hypothetical protein [Terriglobus roseus]